MRPRAWLAAALLACGVSAEGEYDVRGTIRGVDAAERQVEVAHEDIPGFMPAMTMSFDVAPEVALGAVEVGDEVRFKLERRATVLRILELEVTGHGQALGEPGALLRSVGAAGPEPAPDFELVAQDGKAFALRDLRGRRVLLDFIFTRCPGPCPMLTSQHVNVLRRLPEALASETHFVSVSLDPGYDTPERMREYALARGADLERWSFVTGEPADVERVIESYHVGTIRAPDGTLDHLVVTFLIDRAGTIQKRFVGLEHSTADVLSALEAIP